MVTTGVFILGIPLAFAEEVITILPGAQDQNRPRFLDITFYPIEKGKELNWFNDDDISHRIAINMDNSTTTLLADSGIIKPGDSYTHTFEDEGTYQFYSPTHIILYYNFSSCMSKLLKEGISLLDLPTWFVISYT